jgi:organic radical activating enzyme
MPKGQLSIEADEVAARHKKVKFSKFEDLPLVNTGCDSYASWHPGFKNLSSNYQIEELIDRMLSLVPNQSWFQPNGNDVHLVITGGEPLLGWQKSYKEMLSNIRMDQLVNLTFETNGTQPLLSEFEEYLIKEWRPYRGALARKSTITFSVSPKLSASGESWNDAIKPEIVSSYETVGDVYLKFVVETEDHFDEVDRAVKEYRDEGFTGIVYVMPQGGVVTPYEANKVKVADWALARGYCYSPRLHVDLWGNSWSK